MDDEIATLIAEAAYHTTMAVEELAAAFTAMAQFAGIAIKIAVEELAAVADDLFGTPDLRPVATGRQWYLLNHGSPKVRKKWKNALRRKLRIAEKRCKR